MRTKSRTQLGVLPHGDMGSKGLRRSHQGCGRNAQKSMVSWKLGKSILLGTGVWKEEGEKWLGFCSMEGVGHQGKAKLSGTEGYKLDRSGLKKE